MDKKEPFKYERVKEILIIVLMLIPFVIAMISPMLFHNWYDFLPWFKSRSLTPNLLSTLVGIAIFIGLFLRYNTAMFSTIPKTIISVLDILFIASFTNVFVEDKVGYCFLIGGVLFTWIGMRSVAGFAWIILCVCAIPRSISISGDMGFVGAIYVLTAFISFIGQMFWIDMVRFDLSSIKEDFAGIQNRVQTDTQASVKMVSEVKDNIVSAVAMTTPASGIVKEVILNKKEEEGGNIGKRI